jgi:hypothetical protein
MAPEMSLLTFYSYGQVAEDKVRGEVKIKVTPTEVRFSQQGYTDAATNLDKVEHNIRNGMDYIAMPIGNSIPAIWINFNSNRITPPDVMKDDLVLIWRLGDTDMFFWQDRNVANVKRLETAVWAFAADPSKPMAPDLSNAYFLMFSSHDGHITLKTSKANGEFCSFIHQINTKDGRVVLEDDIGNSSWFDSKETDIGWRNVNDSVFRMHKTHIYGYTKDDIKFESKFIGFKCTDFSIECENYDAEATNYSISTSDYSCQADTWNVHATNAAITAPVIGLNGSVSIGGGGSAGASARSGGAISCSITADNINMKVGMFAIDAQTMTVGGAVTFTGPVTMAQLHANAFTHDGAPCC